MSNKTLNRSTMSGTLSQNFNNKACEIEIKLLKPFVDEDSTRVFANITRFFEDKGWVRLFRNNKKLITRQLDVFQTNANNKQIPKPALVDTGLTLRLRGESDDLTISSITAADICAKMGAAEDKSGALRRGEFEAPIKNFRHISLLALKDKYPAHEYPELHDALAGLKRSDLREFFRIDCNRNRYVIEFPPEITGLKDKRFIGELILDDVMFVSDPEPTKKQPTVFHHDLEIECEALFKPCDYDRDPNAAKYVTSPLTQDELDMAMGNIRALLLTLTAEDFKPNIISKAERGFNALAPYLDAVGNRLTLNKQPQKKGRIQNAFRLSAEALNDNLKQHHFLARDFGPFLKTRPIAQHNQNYNRYTA